jgi:hypothetical protein
MPHRPHRRPVAARAARVTPGRRPSAARCSGRRLPTGHELRYAPELAILAAIESAVDVAIVALVAAQPELQPNADGRDRVSTDAGAAADAVIARAQALVSAIADYRAALHDQHDDWPF